MDWTVSAAIIHNCSLHVITHQVMNHTQCMADVGFLQLCTSHHCSAPSARLPELGPFSENIYSMASHFL